VRKSYSHGGRSGNVATLYHCPAGYPREASAAARASGFEHCWQPRTHVLAGSQLADSMVHATASRAPRGPLKPATHLLAHKRTRRLLWVRCIDAVSNCYGPKIATLRRTVHHASYNSYRLLHEMQGAARHQESQGDHDEKRPTGYRGDLRYMRYQDIQNRRKQISAA
jgi:hypothetical protein